MSGREKLIKPDAAIFQLLIERYRVDPASTVFIDDSRRNVDASVAEGLYGIHFQYAAGLRAQLNAPGMALPGQAG